MTPLESRCIAIGRNVIRVAIRFNFARPVAEKLRKLSHGLGRLLDEELLPQIDLLSGQMQLYFVQKNNTETSEIREVFRRTFHHGQVLVLLCMDCRLSLEEIVGDTRPLYYAPRVAGGYISPKVRQMILLAVKNGVRLVILTRHDNCAAEMVSGEECFRDLSMALAERQRQIQLLAEELSSELLDPDPMKRVVLVDAMLDTQTGRLHQFSRIHPIQPIE